MAASPSQREMQAFSRGKEFGALMIPQGGSGTKLSGACSSRFGGDVTADDFLAATQGPFKRQHKRFLCLTMEKWSVFFFCSLKRGWETSLTTSTNPHAKSACPPFPSESQGRGGTTSPKPQQYEDVGEMAMQSAACSKPPNTRRGFSQGRQRTPPQPHPC